jgi:hypothetical protein
LAATLDISRASRRHFLNGTLNTSRGHCLLIWCLPRPFACTQKTFLCANVDTSRGYLNPFWVPPSIFGLHTVAIFSLTPWKIFEDNDTLFWVPPSTLSLHIDANICCQPGHISRTLRQFLGDTVGNSPAHWRYVHLPLWTLLVDTEALLCATLDTLPAHESNFVAAKVDTSRGT